MHPACRKGLPVVGARFWEWSAQGGLADAGYAVALFLGLRFAPAGQPPAVPHCLPSVKAPLRSTTNEASLRSVVVGLDPGTLAARRARGTAKPSTGFASAQGRLPSLLGVNVGRGGKRRGVRQRKPPRVAHAVFWLEVCRDAGCGCAVSTPGAAAGGPAVGGGSGGGRSVTDLATGKRGT